jgi:hypothetical protein
MSAWEKGFVAVILDSNGKPIREFNEGENRTVRVPFDSEYILRFKNTTDARAYVRIEIDGMDVLGGKRLILPAKTTKDLERFLEGDNTKGRKFKFVTAGGPGITDPTSAENGLIRVIFEPESVVTTLLMTTGSLGVTAPCMSSGILRGGSDLVNTGILGSVIGTAYNCSEASISSAVNTGAIQPTTTTNMCLDRDGNSHKKMARRTDIGATSTGSASGQRFTDSNEWFPTLAPIQIDIWMRGPKVVDEPKPFICYPAFQPASGGIFYKGEVMQGVKEFSFSGGEVILKLDPAQITFK